MLCVIGKSNEEQTNILNQIVTCFDQFDMLMPDNTKKNISENTKSRNNIFVFVFIHL